MKWMLQRRFALLRSFLLDEIQSATDSGVNMGIMLYEIQSAFGVRRWDGCEVALEQHRAVHHELPNEGITSFKLELVC
jgi:hypothetical protein